MVYIMDIMCKFHNNLKKILQRKMSTVGHLCLT